MAIFTAIGSAIAAVAGAVGTFIGGLGAVGSFLLRTAVGIGLNLLAQAIAGKPKDPAFSINGTLQAGGDVARSLILGRTATAGSLVWVNTWGNDGDTPNAYLTQVIALADLPVASLDEVWVNGEKITLGPTPHAEYGYPATQYNNSGADHLWVKFYDGTQTAADNFLVTRASNGQRQWQSTRVGRGVAYAIVTAKVSKNMFSGIPNFKFVVSGSRLYDPSKDSTVPGGSGVHRWAQPETWGGDGDHLPAVQIYNLLRGIQYNGQWFYGLQGMTSARLPSVNWIAQINKCRAVSNGNATYRSAGEIPVEAPLATAIEALLTACQGRLAELGGIYDIYVGEPDAPVASFSDDDILSTEEQSFTPFFGLADTINGIAATYPSPDDGWSAKSAPPLYRTDLEALAGNRRLMADVSLDFVPYDEQVQRLMKSALLEGQRARRHTLVLPPRYWPYAVPGAVLSWTSERNGYVSKLFRVDGAADRANLDVMIDITEVDPADYNWDRATDYKQPVDGAIGVIRPAPQPLIGWQVFPSTIGQAGKEMPSIRVAYPGQLDDVRAVRVQVRLAGETEPIFDGEVPYGDPATNDAQASVVLAGTFAPNTDYQARGVFVPYGAREAEWSEWLPVTTPNVWLSLVYTPGMLEEIDQHVEEMLDWLNSDSPIYELGQEVSANTDAIVAERAERMVDVGGLADRWRDLYETVNRTAFSVAENWIGQKREFVIVREELADVDSGARAYADDVVNLAIGPGSALSERLTTIEASADANYVALSGAIDTVQQVALNAVADEATARQALRIQLVGNYTGNDIEQVTSGLLYQDRQAWISETQAITRAVDGLAAGIGNASLFDWIKDWSWESTLLGWTGNGTPTVANGWLRPANHASDPYIVSPADLGVNGSLYKQVRLYIRKTGNPVWDGYLWWQADSDTTWDAARRVAITEPTYIDEQAAVTVNAEWTGTLNQIRIDLSAAQTADDCFEVSYVYIGRPSPGASQAQVSAVQQALASQILAEASSREALSVALTGLADPTGATIPSLSQGLLYDERVARVSGDEANTLLIQGVAAQIDDPSTGLDALAQVQSTMQGQISSLDGAVTVMGQSIDDLALSVDELETGKADIGITDGLQAQINQMGGGEGLSLLAESMRSMRLTVDRLALGQAGVWLAGQNDRRELGNIVADVHQEATSRIDITDDQVALHGRILDQINLDLGGKAGLDIVSALDGRVTATEGEIETIGTSLVSINASIGDLETGKADASAVNGLTTRVTDTEDGLQSLSEALIGVDARVDGVSAEGKFRVAATATETGALSTLGLSVAATASGATQQAAMLMSARSDGKSMIGFLADMVYFTDGSGNSVHPVVIEGGAARMNVANIGTVNAGVIQSPDNKFKITLTEGKFEWWD